ncbi:MAG: phage baseplate assembly protein V [Candidatus Reddybacter sp.]
MSSLEDTLSDMARRLANIITLGTVHSVSGALCRVAIGGDEGHLTPAIKWLAGRASATSHWSQLRVGEQVLLLSPSGDIGNAVAVPSVYSSANPAPSTDPDETVNTMPDGAVFRYNHNTSVLDVILPGSATSNIASAGGINLTGDLSVTGDINATGDISDQKRSMQGDRDIYNSHTGHENGSTPGAQQ